MCFRHVQHIRFTSLLDALIIKLRICDVITRLHKQTSELNKFIEVNYLKEPVREKEFPHLLWMTGNNVVKCE